MSRLEEFPEHIIDDGAHSWPRFEITEDVQPWTPVDAFMTTDSDLAAIPHSLTFMAGAGRETVPAGMCVVDTVALIGCGGDRTLDRFIGTFGSSTTLKASNKVLKGVNADAPVLVQHQQWIDISIAGQKGRVALHRIPNSDVPQRCPNPPFSLPPLVPTR